YDPRDARPPTQQRPRNNGSDPAQRGKVYGKQIIPEMGVAEILPAPPIGRFHAPPPRVAPGVGMLYAPSRGDSYGAPAADPYYYQQQQQQQQQGYQQGNAEMGSADDRGSFNSATYQGDDLPLIRGADKPTPLPAAGTAALGLDGEDLGNPKYAKGRRYCGCFRSRSGCRRFWVIFLVLFLGGLGAAVYLLFPRAPQVVISNPWFAPGAAGVVTFGDMAKASVAEPYTIQFNMMVNVSVYSPNYEPIWMSKLMFSGNLLDNSGNVLAGSTASGIATSVMFSPMANTSFILPITLSYNLTKPGSIQSLANTDPGIKLVSQNCGLVGGRPKNLEM
ncbi:hypothetical protein HK101_006037, partial [Irineochytrium annulatum]